MKFEVKSNGDIVDLQILHISKPPKYRAVSTDGETFYYTSAELLEIMEEGPEAYRIFADE